MPRSWPATVKHLCSVLLTFSDHDGENIYPSVATLVEHTGEKERTVQRARQFLRRGGFLISMGVKIHRNGTTTSRDRLDFAAIIAARELEDGAAMADKTTAKRTDRGVTRDDEMVSPVAGDGVTSDTQPKERTKEERIPEQVLAREGFSGSDGFEVWWAAYPRHVRRDAALRAYQWALTQTDAATLLSAVKAARFDPDPQFQPHAANWLRGRRWEDEDDTGGIDPVLRAAGLTTDCLLGAVL